MEIVEWTKLGLLILLGICASYGDLKTGLITNCMVLSFSALGLVLNVYYLGFVEQSDVFIFIGNLFSCIIVAFLLYRIHAFAGGDLKLVVAMSLLYPSSAYLTYNTSRITMFLAIGFAIFWGYVYLLISTVVDIGRGKVSLDRKYIQSCMTFYLKTYVTAMLYIMLFTMAVSAFSLFIFPLPAWFTIFGSFVIAWISGKYSFLRNQIFLSMAIVLDVILAILLKISPIPLNPSSYLLTAILVLCQVTIRVNLYRTIPTEDIQKGMILSMASSLSMQGSRIRGLPGISSEDLRDRLSEEQVQSIRRWGKSSKGLDNLVIVRKIPFAVFIMMGYMTYFVLWRIIL